MTIERTLSDGVAALQPDAVQAYLRSRGWKDDGPEGPWARAFVKPTVGSEAELLVATRSGSRDYAPLMSILVDRLARVEGMTREAVLRDLSMAGFDVLRVRVVDAADGSVDLDDSLVLMREARALIVAAANATAARTPRRNYTGRQHESVAAFVNKVRMGQTERGSFVIPLLAPYAFDLGANTNLPGEWFGRQVMRKLVAGLQAVERALSGSGEPPADAFLDRASEGVSANLCQALGRMVEAGGAVELKVRWAAAQPETAMPDPVSLFTGSSSALLRASARLAEADPPPAEPIIGFVTRLIDDRAVVETWMDGHLRNVHLTIPQAYRTTFATAWDQRKAVDVAGDLAIEGRRLTLRVVSDARLVEADPED